MTVLCRDVQGLRDQVALWRKQGLSVGLVPTMGALHAGHLELVAAARRSSDRVVVTIFVNPTQFAPNEDFSSYPRDLDADCRKAGSAGVDLIYAPDLATIYPPGFATRVEVGAAAVAGLEDRFRPTHFAGVATIVTKLLLQCGPDVAVFGEKDFQQLKTIERMVADLDIPVRIQGLPIVREADGLALSSRNAYLSADERRRAPQLHAALAQCAAEIETGAAANESVAHAVRVVSAAGFLVDYIEPRRASDLSPWDGAEETEGRLLAAARLGRTRLIDNVAVNFRQALLARRKGTG